MTSQGLWPVVDTDLENIYTLNAKVKFYLNHYPITTTNGMQVTILTTKARVEGKYDVVGLIHLGDNDLIEKWQSTSLDKQNKILLTDSYFGHNLLLTEFKE